MALQGLCALFAPGNRHAVVGTKEGTLQVLDVGASTVLDTLDAHKGAVRAFSSLHWALGMVMVGALPLLVPSNGMSRHMPLQMPEK